MSLRIFSLIYLLSIIFLILPTTHAVPTNIKTLESNDIETLPDLFPSIIDKFQETIKRFRCPKGWKRLGGSCYYYSNLTSISSHVNYTCNHIHSNHSNLIQIRNAVELFYAAHVLSRNNLTSLMIDIHPSLLKGKKVADMLMKDTDRWERMKNLFPIVRVKYQRLKKKIFDRLSSTGLRITLRGAKKNKSEQGLIHDEYEYNDLDSSDEIDEFEKIKDLRGICDDIHWNVLNNTNTTTVYILTTYNILDTTICSLSEVEPETKYNYICEYVLDFCFANILCGKHGHCINTLSGFKCACSILYGGLFCERITQQGIQLILASIIIIILGVLNSCLILYLVKPLKSAIKKRCKKAMRKKNKNAEKDEDESQSSIHLLNSVQIDPNITIINNEELRSTSSLSTLTHFDVCRNLSVGFLSIVILFILYSMILLRYYKLFKINSSEIIDSKYLLNSTIHLVKQCTSLSNYRISGLAFAPGALTLSFIFYILIKIQNTCSGTSINQHSFLPPIQPFSAVNRMTTATVFGILAFEILRIFEELLFSLDSSVKSGVIVELLIRIGTIVIVGLHYYPILVSLHSDNIIVRFLICIYIMCIVTYTIIREGSCMGYLPLSGKHTIGEEAKLRMELGTWFILYGLIKNIPHFFFLSYITAELCVRFLYDSICIGLKNPQNMEFIPAKPNDDRELPISHRKKSSKQKQNLSQINIQQDEVKQSCLQECLNLIYVWDNDFHFTTMVICTYTVAVVFLYYLGCTFIFLYISRTTGHIAFVKSYIESSANIQLPATPFKPEIIISAVVTVIIYGVQLFLGIKQYKIDKTELKNKNTKHGIPPIDYFNKDLIASNSVHYPGFLIGYLAWGFVLCSHLILAILIGIRIFYLNMRHATLVLGIIVPILMLYLLKSVSMRTVGDSFLIRRDKKDDKCTVRHRRIYAVFIYFMFFADCYLGIASYIIRLLVATLINLLFMARLDYSSLGRPLDKYDDGYAAYVSFLYMELNHTHSENHNAINENLGASSNKKCCKIVNDDDKSEENRSQERDTNFCLNVCIRNQTNDESMRSITHDASLCTTIREPKTSSLPREPDSIHDINNTANKTNPSIPDAMSNSVTLNSMPTTDKDTQNTDDKKSTKQPSTNVVKQTIQEKLQPKTNDVTDDDDDDGGISTKKLIKKREKEEAKKAKKADLKKKKQSIKTEDSADDDEEEDRAMSKLKQKNKELKVKKKSMFTKCFQDQQNDNDVSKQKNKKQIPKDEDEDEDGGPIVKTYSTIKIMMSSKKPVLDNLTAKDESSNDASDHNQNSKPKKTNDEIQIVEEPAVQTITTDSSRSNHQKSYENKVYLLRTTSYRQAQQRSPPVVSQRPLNTFAVHSRSNTNVDENHYSEIEGDANRLSMNDFLYLIIQTMRSLSSYTSEQQTLTNENNSEVQKKKEIQKRRKIARTRWHLAYTLKNNPSLFEGRKKVLEEKRLLELSQQQTSKPTTTNNNSVPNTDNMKSGTLRSRRIKAKTAGSLYPQSPDDLRFLPMPDIDEESHDLVRNPIPIQLPPLNNANTQQTKTTSHNKSTQQISTTTVLQQKNANLPTTHHEYINTRDTKKVKSVA